MRHISVILLTLPDGRIVFQRRAKDVLHSPGRLGLFGGHQEDGETFDQTMIRELEEETSLKINDLQWGFVQDFMSGDATFHLYWGEVPTADFEVYEGDRSETYTYEQALARDDLAVSTDHVIRTILKKKE